MTELIVALDVPTFDEAQRVLGVLDGLPVTYKVGMESYYAYGTRLLGELERKNARYFLDLKFHDIPRTVAAAVRATVASGVRILNIHALGGAAMMAIAVEAAEERASELGIAPPEMFAVTILTSIASEDLPELGLGGGLGENAIRLAALARDARCTGVVCSAHEVADLKTFFGSHFKTLTPGIRPAGASRGDQRRVMTPREAAETETDYIVVGRPILQAADPREMALAILHDIAPSVAAR